MIKTIDVLATIAASLPAGACAATYLDRNYREIRPERFGLGRYHVAIEGDRAFVSPLADDGERGPHALIFPAAWFAAA